MTDILDGKTATMSLSSEFNRDRVATSQAT